MLPKLLEISFSEYQRWSRFSSQLASAQTQYPTCSALKALSAKRLSTTLRGQYQCGRDGKTIAYQVSEGGASERVRRAQLVPVKQLADGRAKCTYHWTRLALVFQIGAGSTKPQGGPSSQPLRPPCNVEHNIETRLVTLQHACGQTDNLQSTRCDWQVPRTCFQSHAIFHNSEGQVRDLIRMQWSIKFVLEGHKPFLSTTLICKIDSTDTLIFKMRPQTNTWN